MALISCTDCKAQVSTQAKACPACGAPVKSPPSGAAQAFGLLLLAGGGIAALIVSQSPREFRSPEDVQRREEQRVIDKCRDDMADPLLTFAQKEAERYLCDGLRKRFVEKWQREP